LQVEINRFFNQFESKDNESDIESLIEKLNKNLKFLGGFTKCYHNEKKTRVFVDTVLMHYIESTWSDNINVYQEPIIYLDMEVELKLFGKPPIKPDY
jgi:hypothetical protein